MSPLSHATFAPLLGCLPPQRDGHMADIVHMLQGLRSCGKSWRRATRAWEGSLPHKRSTLPPSLAPSPDTRTEPRLPGASTKVAQHVCCLEEKRGSWAKWENKNQAEPSVFLLILGHTNSSWESDCHWQVIRTNSKDSTFGIGNIDPATVQSRGHQIQVRPGPMCNQTFKGEWLPTELHT